MSKIRELEIELSEIQNEIGKLEADMLDETDEDNLDWYISEINHLRNEESYIIEEIRHLEIEGEY